MDPLNQDKQAKAPKLDFNRILEIIGSGGLFERGMRHFESRAQQCHMSANVVDAYNQNNITLIEAGTGTGKSIAYILPAILWALNNKQRTVISTHTITLQEQLIHRDIPNIVRALNVDIKAVLAKGMSNYLCKRKLDETKQEILLIPPAEAEELYRIEAWAETTKDGSKMSLPKIPMSSAWERVSAESDSCSNNKCPYYKDCFFFKARQEAEDAQIIVVNHHLLFADLAYRRETNDYDAPAILPSYSRVIIDEAHHIEDVATDFFGNNVSKLGILRTISRIAAEKSSQQSGKLPMLKDKLIQHVPEMVNLINKIQYDLPHLRQELLTDVIGLFDLLTSFVATVTASLKPENEDSKNGENKLRLQQAHTAHRVWIHDIQPQTIKAVKAIQSYVQTIMNLERDLKAVDNDRFQEQSKGIRLDTLAYTNRLASAASLLDQFLLAPLPNNKVRWIELQKLTTTTNISLIDADLDVSKAMVEYFLSRFSTIVLCSATLTTNRQFKYVRERLGITPQSLPERGITTHIYDSPFNYQKQALFAIPTDLPLPSHPEFTDKAVEQVWRAIEITRGGSFLLFTSYGMMEKFYQILAPRLLESKYALYKQGDANRQLLLTQFKNSNRSVLFGTDTFWEGVDIAGEALRCVIIVKLPFKVPSEPIVQARTEEIKAKGGDPFYEYSLPSAVVKFTQGFGRLIRGHKDRGCVLCLDTRIATKSYGAFFLNTIPKCQTLFADSATIEKEMREFYRKTHYLVVQ